MSDDLAARLIALRDQLLRLEDEACSRLDVPEDIAVQLSSLSHQFEADVQALLLVIREDPTEDYAREVCICAAIVTREGEIVRGHRHDDAILTAGNMGLKPSSLGDTQGFITSRNRFVDRAEAMQLQRAAGKAQPNGETLCGDLLFSEDLYLRRSGDAT